MAFDWEIGEKYPDYKLLGYEEEGNSLRRLGNTFIGRLYTDSDQLWNALQLGNNSILFQKNHRNYDVYFDSTLGTLMVADKEGEIKTCMCFYKDCRMMGEGANEKLLCEMHLTKCRVVVTHNFPRYSDLDRNMILFRKQHADLVKTLSRDKPLLYLKYGIELTIKTAIGFIPNLTDDLKVYPPFSSERVEECLKNMVTKTLFTFGNFAIRYNELQSRYEYRNLDEDPNWKGICSSRLCMSPSVENLDVCRKCGGGFKEVTMKAIALAVGKKTKDHLRDSDIEVLEEILRNLPRNRLNVDGMWVKFERSGRLALYMSQNKIWHICMNWDGGCYNLSHITYLSGHCGKCQRSEIHYAYLYYLAPYDAYLTMSSSKPIMNSAAAVNSYFPDVPVKVGEVEEVKSFYSTSSRKAAQSFCGAFVLILMMKKLFNGGRVELASKGPPLGNSPWRAANFILSQYGIRIEKREDVKMPVGYNPAIILDKAELLKLPKNPFIYYAEDGQGSYVGLSYNTEGSKKTTVARYHYFQKINDESMFRKLQLRTDDLDTKGERVATLENNRHYTYRALESTMMFAYIGAMEFYGVGFPLLNYNLSSLEMPKNFMFDVARIVKHITGGSTIWPSTEDQNIWTNVLEPKTRQARDPTRGLPIK